MQPKTENSINKLVDLISKDYEKGRTIDVIETLTPPDKNKTVKIIYQIQNLIFPGYFKNNGQHTYTVQCGLRSCVEDVLYDLSEQISLALKFSPEFADKTKEEITAVSQEYAFDFLGKLPEIREILETDLQSAYDGDPAAFNKPEIILSYPGLFAITVNRLAHELYLMNVPLLPRMMTEFAHSETGIDIHPGAVLGKHFFIDHGTGTVIGETAKIGDNVKIYQGVTLGAISTSDGQKLHGKKRHPTIEDNVTIYAGATILGGETVIGSGSVIGGNVFITSSVPQNTKVIAKTPELEYRPIKQNS